MEDLDKLARLLDELVKRRDKLREELRLLDDMISVLEGILRERSYVPASQLAAREAERPRPEALARTAVLVRWKGEPVCQAEIYDDRVVVGISPSIGFPTSDRLAKYLIREMEKYLEEDLKAQAEGRIPPDQRFLFTIDEDERGNLTKIEFIDHGREDRRRDLLGKIRWAVNRFVSEKEEGIR